MAEHNPRRALLAQLDDAHRRLKALRDRWRVSATVWDTSLAETTALRSSGGGWRKMRPDEFPENRPDAWSAVWNELGALSAEIVAARAHAEAQYFAALERQKVAADG